MDIHPSPPQSQPNHTLQPLDWLNEFLGESLSSGTAPVLPGHPMTLNRSSSPSMQETAEEGEGGEVEHKSVQRKETSKKSSGESSRTRVVIACEGCRSRKGKCDGAFPCSNCSKSKRKCIYKHAQRKVWISQNSFLQLEKERDDLRRLCVALSEQVVSLGATPIQEVPRGSVKPELRTRNGGVMSLHPDSSEITSMPNLEEVGHVERGGVDQSQTQVETGQPLTEVNMEQGDDEEDTADQVASGLGKLMMDPGGTARYMGHTSSPAFYARLSQIIPSLVPLAGIVAPPLPPNTYHTADWQPLPILDQNPYELPSREIAQHYVALFFHYSGDLFYWADPEETERDLTEIYQHSHVGEIDLWKLCTLNAMLAMGARHVGASPTTTDRPWPGLEYFARAKLLMLSIWEDGSIASIRCLVLMSSYLLSASRRDDSYCYAGMALRSCIMLGLHRKLESDRPLTPEENVAQEQRRRLFWSAYCMERLISCALGRPRILDDDDIDVEQPSICAELHDIGPPSGLLCNIAIRQIEGRMNKELYRVTPDSVCGDEYSVSNALKLLKDIDAAANKFLPSDFGGQQFRNPRARIILKLSFNQAIIVVCRPALLHFLRQKANQDMDVMSLPGISPRSISAASSLEELQNRAITAARESAQLLGLLSSSGMILIWSFFDIHFTFNAAMILLLEQLLNPYPANPSNTTISTLRDILSRMANSGNESAISCSDIIASLSLSCDLSKMR